MEVEFYNFADLNVLFALYIYVYFFQNHADILKRVFRDLPAHEEEDKGDDAEDDDNHCKAGEHCCCPDVIK